MLDAMTQYRIYINFDVSQDFDLVSLCRRIRTKSHGNLGMSTASRCSRCVIFIFWAILLFSTTTFILRASLFHLFRILGHASCVPTAHSVKMGKNRRANIPNLRKFTVIARTFDVEAWNYHRRSVWNSLALFWVWSMQRSDTMDFTCYF